MKTIEGTPLNILYSIMLLTFLFAGELTFQYYYPNNSISKEGSPTRPCNAQNQPYWDTKQMKEKESTQPWSQTNVTSLAMPRRSLSIMPKRILYLCATLELNQS
jgi:hypothetical protein